jgi:hypothetical protein
MFPPTDLVRMLTADRTERCRDAMPRRRPGAARNAAVAALRHVGHRLGCPKRAGLVPS